MNHGQQLDTRYRNRMVGSFLIITLVLILVGISKSGVVERWFNPLQKIRVLLPQEGLFGLSAGSDVEILGTHGGYVESIVIEPDQRIYAEVLIRRDALPFIRSDSTITIRKQFGVAGDSYLEISRGFGEEIDWDFAVLEANTDRAPTDLLQATIEEIRAQVVPTLEESRRAVTAFADMAEQLNSPEGELARTLAAVEQISAALASTDSLFGKLINDKAFADQFDTMMTRLSNDLEKIEPLLDSLNETAKKVDSVVTVLDGEAESLPEMTKRATASLAALEAILADVEEASPRLPQITDNLADTTANLPGLLVQVRSTLGELEQLTRQLQSNWLIGGGRAADTDTGLTPVDATP